MKAVRNAEILCVGTELLLGDIVNTDSAYISRSLALLGISVYRQAVIGDNPDRLRDMLSECFSRTDCVVLTGGLGPTCDDLTKEVVAEYFGLALEINTTVLDRIKDYFDRIGRIMTKNNEKQAEVPTGARILTNDWGTAPGLIIEKGGKTAILLPGPPSELEPMWDERVVPYLSERSGSTIISRNVHIIGMGESAVEELLRPMMREYTNPTVAPYAGTGEVRVRVSASAVNEKEATSMCDRVIDEILATEVGQFVYGIDVDSIENALLLKLRSEGKTLAVAESCTGGLIAKRITDLPGCSDVFLGGCVTYANEAKTNLIGVKPETLAAHGAVSEQTAAEMARGVRLALAADVGIATTGIAGPGGGTPEKPVGTVYIAVSTKNGESVKLLSLSSNHSRAYIRTSAATQALSMALKS